MGIILDSSVIIDAATLNTRHFERIPGLNVITL
jgi:predicted nucleic acid-binding protein